jgi:hypothetical protein
MVERMGDDDEGEDEDEDERREDERVWLKVLILCGFFG